MSKNIFNNSQRQFIIVSRSKYYVYEVMKNEGYIINEASIC